MSNDVKETLAERGNNYGSFGELAKISQALKAILLAKQEDFTATQAEALEMICVKLARIANGDPNYADSWLDIAGYAQLVVEDLQQLGGGK